MLKRIFFNLFFISFFAPVLCQNALTLYIGSSTPKGDTEASRAFSTEYHTGVNFGAKYDLEIIRSIFLSPRFENSHFFANSDIPITTPDNTFLITADDSNIYRFYLAATYRSVRSRISPIFSFGFGYNIEEIGRVYVHQRNSNDGVRISSFQYQSQNYFAQAIDLGLMIKVYKQLSFEVLYSSISNYKERKFHNVNFGLALIRK